MQVGRKGDQIKGVRRTEEIMNCLLIMYVGHRLFGEWIRWRVLPNCNEWNSNICSINHVIDDVTLFSVKVHQCSTNMVCVQSRNTPLLTQYAIVFSLSLFLVGCAEGMVCTIDIKCACTCACTVQC